MCMFSFCLLFLFNILSKWKKYFNNLGFISAFNSSLEKYISWYIHINQLQQLTESILLFLIFQEIAQTQKHNSTDEAAMKQWEKKLKEKHLGYLQ